MKFSLEITSKTDLSVLPGLKDVYVTMLPGTDYREVARKADELVRSGYNPIPHFPARSIKDLKELKRGRLKCLIWVDSFQYLLERS